MPPGFAPTGGGAGFGFAPTGGGAGLLMVLDGRDDAGELSLDAAGVFFHGAALPFAAAIPGKTDTGFAEALALTALIAAAAGVTFDAVGAGLIVDVGRGRVGGGGGAAGAAGASSR